MQCASPLDLWDRGARRPEGSRMRVPRPARLGAAGLVVVATLAGATLPVRALDPKEITTETLSNGMRVVLWPDHSIPNLALYTFFRVGSRNERPGITGLSHFFEHMMFLGSKN